MEFKGGRRYSLGREEGEELGLYVFWVCDSEREVFGYMQYVRQISRMLPFCLACHVRTLDISQPVNQPRSVRWI